MYHCLKCKNQPYPWVHLTVYTWVATRAYIFQTGATRTQNEVLAATHQHRAQIALLTKCPRIQTFLPGHLFHTKRALFSPRQQAIVTEVEL